MLLPLRLWVQCVDCRTQYEAWLSFQATEPGGLRPATEGERRCTIVPILNANSSIRQSLLDTWSHKTPAEAYETLSQDDVSVTNKSDKLEQPN